MSQLSPKKAKEWIDLHDDVLLIDARSRDEYRISHIPWAVNIPVDEVEQNSERLKRTEKILVYCNTWNSSTDFINRAKQSNITHLTNLVWWMSVREQEWFDVNKKRNVLPLMRQVMIAAWSLILIWVLFWNFVHPWFLWLTIFVWCGLLFAGLSWFCGMSELLALMPWNRFPDDESRDNFSSNDGSVFVHQFEDKDLSHFSYALMSNAEMILVDPSRNPEPYYLYAKEHNATIVWVIETHPHADFASSHAEIAHTTWATIYCSSLVWATYTHTWFDDWDSISVWSVTLSSLHTPGHSPDGISILVKDASWRSFCVFTGDTLFVWDVGRADLRAWSWNLQQQQKELAKAMYVTTREKLMTLDPQTIVLPAHGSGTLCGKWVSDANMSTIEQELATNPALQSMSEDEFIDYLTTDQPDIPLYFSTCVEGNIQWYRSMHAVQKSMSVVPFAEIDDPNSVIDTRSTKLHRRNWPTGAVHIPLGKQFPTILGSLYDFSKKHSFIVQSEKQYLELIESLAKIWGEEICAWVVIMDQEELRSYVLSQDDDPSTYHIIDVRPRESVLRNPMFADPVTSRIPLHELTDRMSELPEGKILIPYCGGTYTSWVALSLLKKHSPDKVLRAYSSTLLESMPLA